MIIKDSRLLVAADVMTPNPITLGRGTSVKDACAFLLASGISAAPVVNEDGRAIGVVSLTDIAQQFGIATERTTVNDILMPLIFSVLASDTLQVIVDAFLARKVHRLFVTDADGVLEGVITSLDILKALNSSPV